MLLPPDAAAAAASPPNSRLPSLPRGFRFFLATSAAASVLALGLVYRSVYFSPAPSNKYDERPCPQKKVKNISLFISETEIVSSKDSSTAVCTFTWTWGATMEFK